MATSPLVPGRLPVGVEDHAYMVEPSGFRRETVQVLRQQADTAAEPGEQSLNPQGLWRRSQESWHHGAGQDFLDGKDEKAADPHRFRSSKGIDPWTKGQVSLLNEAVRIWSSSSTNLAVAIGGPEASPWLLLADGTEIYANNYPVNLVGMTNSSFEDGTFGTWTAGAGTTIAASNTWAYMGSYSLRLTSNGSTNPSASTPAGASGIPVAGLRTYRLTTTLWHPAATTDRTWTLAVSFYNAAGTLLGTSSTTTTPIAANSPTSVFFDSTAPETAAYAQITLTVVGTASTGENHYADSVVFMPSGSGTFYNAVWRTVAINAGQAAQTVQSIATDGTNLWAALGTSGLHRNTIGTTTSTADSPAAPAGGQISLVGYANGFLLAAGSAGTSTTRENTLWRVDDPTGATPTLTLIKTHPNTSFRWAGIASGRSVAYAWGNGGSNGEVYKVPFDAVTGTLTTAASSATALPDGESIYALSFYAGGIIMGTSKGVRLGQVDGSGNIDYGPLIETDWPVRCLEPQGRYCWFGMSRYDGTSSGLGRIDLGYFTDTLTPAWASDLMMTGTGDVLSATTWTSRWQPTAVRDFRIFAVSGSGVWAEETGTRVASATLDTGTFRFSTSEPKLTRSVDVRHHALPTGAAVAVALDRESAGAWSALGSSTTVGSYGPATPLSAGDAAFEAAELRFTLTRAAATAGPEFTRWTLKALPRPSTIDETFTIPLIMRRTVSDLNDAAYAVDVPAEIAYLKGLERDRTLVNLQLGDEEHTVYLLGSEFVGQNWAPNKEHMEGVLNTVWQTVRG